MPSPGNQSPENPGINWPAIIRTLLVQVLILLALSAAVVRYLDWSSETAWAEFTAASKSSASDAGRHPQSSVPVQTARGQTPCDRRS
jgi:hypothetical protein